MQRFARAARCVAVFSTATAPSSAPIAGNRATSSTTGGAGGAGYERARSSNSWRSGASRAFVLCSAVATTLGFVTVAAKAPDTPEYLLPYYLRSARARFNHYASIREKGGVRFMTTDDFVAAMLCLKEGTEVPSAAVEELATMFAEADANSDGRISFREFSFLAILLCTKMRDFEIAFTMFDEDGKGGLNKAEFKRMMSVFGDETMKPTMKSGLAKNIFDSHKYAPSTTGRTGLASKLAATREPIATFEQFQKVIRELEREVAVAEFRMIDTERTGSISRQAFGELVTNSILGRHLPFFMVDNMRRMDADHAGEKAVTLDSWLVFNDLMKNSETVIEALRMLTVNGLPVRRADFQRAVAAPGVLSRAMTPSEVDLVFELFDRDGDGTLEEDEFAAVVRNKASYNVLEPEKHRNNFFVQLAKCTERVVLGAAQDESDL